MFFLSQQLLDLYPIYPAYPAHDKEIPKNRVGAPGHCFQCHQLKVIAVFSGVSGGRSNGKVQQQQSHTSIICMYMHVYAFSRNYIHVLYMRMHLYAFIYILCALLCTYMHLLCIYMHLNAYKCSKNTHKCV